MFGERWTFPVKVCVRMVDVEKRMTPRRLTDPVRSDWECAYRECYNGGSNDDDPIKVMTDGRTFVKAGRAESKIRDTWSGRGRAAEDDLAHTNEAGFRHLPLTRGRIGHTDGDEGLRRTTEGGYQSWDRVNPEDTSQYRRQR
jgi:hypothetical protein